MTRDATPVLNYEVDTTSPARSLLWLTAIVGLGGGIAGVLFQTVYMVRFPTVTVGSRAADIYTWSDIGLTYVNYSVWGILGAAGFLALVRYPSRSRTVRALSVVVLASVFICEMHSLLACAATAFHWFEVRGSPWHPWGVIGWFASFAGGVIHCGTLPLIVLLWCSRRYPHEKIKTIVAWACVIYGFLSTAVIQRFGELPEFIGRTIHLADASLEGMDHVMNGLRVILLDVSYPILFFGAIYCHVSRRRRTFLIRLAAMMMLASIAFEDAWGIAMVVAGYFGLTDRFGSAGDPLESVFWFTDLAKHMLLRGAFPMLLLIVLRPRRASYTPKENANSWNV